jgi:hypothetical protein
LGLDSETNFAAAKKATLSLDHITLLAGLLLDASGFGDCPLVPAVRVPLLTALWREKFRSDGGAALQANPALRFKVNERFDGIEGSAGAGELCALSLQVGALQPSGE